MDFNEDRELRVYLTCQMDICKKEKQEETKQINKILKRMNDPTSKHRVLQQKLEAKYGAAFLREQQNLIKNSLKRDYIVHSMFDKDMETLKAKLHPKLVNDSDFSKLLKSRTRIDQAKQKKAECIETVCGPEPTRKGGTRKRRKKTKVMRRGGRRHTQGRKRH